MEMAPLKLHTRMYGVEEVWLETYVYVYASELYTLSEL